MDKTQLLFLNSVVLGIVLWIFFYVITPIQIVNKLSIGSISFIATNYIALIAGFFIKWPKIERPTNGVAKEYEGKLPKMLLKFLIGIIVVSFVIRYFELFYVRDMSLANSIVTNRVNVSRPEHFSLGMNLLSVFRTLYFVPLIFFYSIKGKKSVSLLVFCLILFVLPLPEGVLRGSRRMIFELLILLVLIVLVFKKIKFQSLKTLVITFIGILFLLLFSKKMIETRRIGSQEVKRRINFESAYSEFVPAKKRTKDYILNTENNLVKSVLFSGLHTGQYIVHGVYEMDHMISQNPNHKYGLCNGFLLVKFFNKLGITNIPLGTLSNPAGRNTYISAFGWLFIDFGWFSLMVMFFFGTIQRIIFLQSEKNILLRPVMIILVFCNLFLLVFNFMRAQFIFTLMVYSVFLGILWLYVKYKTHSGIHFKRNNKISS